MEIILINLPETFPEEASAEHSQTSPPSEAEVSQFSCQTHRVKGTGPGDPWVRAACQIQPNKTGFILN